MQFCFTFYIRLAISRPHELRSGIAKPTNRAAQYTFLAVLVSFKIHPPRSVLQDRFIVPWFTQRLVTRSFTGWLFHFVTGHCSARPAEPGQVKRLLTSATLIFSLVDTKILDVLMQLKTDAVQNIIQNII